jgi:hypothetical protein
MEAFTITIFLTPTLTALPFDGIYDARDAVAGVDPLVFADPAA